MNWQGQSVLVTGAGGFIGSQLPMATPRFAMIFNLHYSLIHR